MSSQKTVKVKNISTKPLNLLNGTILPGKEGLATAAETQNHPDCVEIVEKPVEVLVEKPVKSAVVK